jgi:hypothetical protein
MDAATVSLVGNGSACGCECLTCLGVDNDLLLTVTGGDYPGTYLLTKDSEVFFSPDGAPGYSQCIFGSADFGSPAKNWFIVIDCRGCEVLDVRLFLRESPNDPIKYAESLAVACSDPITLTTLVGDGTYEVS